MRRLYLPSLIALAAFNSRPAAAETRTWLPVSGTWDDPANWSDNTLPTIYDRAIIDDGRTAEVSSGVSGAVNVVNVGDSGVGLLNISGGTIHADVVSLGDLSGSNGTLNIASGAMDYGTLMVGNVGNGTLNIDGGTVTCAGYNTYIGSQGGSSGTATVTAGTWNAAGYLHIGYGGSGALNVAGGTVTSLSSYLGSSSATVTAGTWNNSDSLIIGYYGGASSLDIAGGSVSDNHAYLGYNSNNTATVTGGIWTNTTSLNIGYYSQGNLNIDGGDVVAGNSYVGSESGGQGVVTITSGTWSTASELRVGNTGSGSLTINGGTVSNQNAYVAYHGSGTAIINNGAWNNAVDLHIGSFGNGTLEINGGTVTASSTIIGAYGGSQGSATIHDGSWSSSYAIIAGDAGTGTLEIQGGTIESSYGWIGRNPGSSGTATITGGTWNAYSISVGIAGDGMLNLTGGSVTLDGGDGTMFLSQGGSGIGTLNIGTGGNAGTLHAAQIFGYGISSMVNFNHSGSLSFAPQMNNTLAVNKTGNGTTTLTGTSNYYGPTLVEQGTLAVSGNGSINGTSGVTISAGAVFAYNSSVIYTGGVITNNDGTISGSGTIGIQLVLDSHDDTIAPGNSPGIMSFTIDQTWQAFTYEWETHDFTGTMAGTDFDQIAIDGTLVLTGGIADYQLDLISLSADNLPGNVPNFFETDRQWTILTASGGITGFDASWWTLNTGSFATSPNHAGSFTLSADAYHIYLTYTAIPEPTLCAMSLLASGTLLIRRKRA